MGAIASTAARVAADWIDDIDEAIVSRCIALIRFHPPNAPARRRIWSVMTEQFGLEVAPTLLDALVNIFPAATGRDIKGLAKLVAKYCGHRGVPPTLDVFERCAIFRGIDLRPVGPDSSEPRLSPLSQT